MEFTFRNTHIEKFITGKLIRVPHDRSARVSDDSVTPFQGGSGAHRLKGPRGYFETPPCCIETASYFRAQTKKGILSFLLALPN